MVNQFKGHDEIYLDDKTVLDYFGMKGSSEWANIGYGALFFVFFFTMTGLSLTYKQHVTR
jgi:hypothetical protein